MITHNCYAEMNKQDNELMKSENTKQIKNAKYNQKRKEMKKKSESNNFEEDLQKVEDLVDCHPFVQEVFRSKDKVPSVILYTQEQICDIQRFCLLQGQVLSLIRLTTWARFA